MVEPKVAKTEAKAVIKPAQAKAVTKAKAIAVTKNAIIVVG